MPKYPSYYVRPDGLHETILRINGKRKAFRGKTDKEVWEKVKAFDRAQLQAEIDAETTFSRIAEHWWDEAEPKLEPNSVKNYKPALRRAVDEFGTRQVGSITAKEIDAFIRDFAATRARKTVAMQLQVIRQTLRWAELQGKTNYNPAQAVRVPRNLPQARREAPDKDQIAKIKTSANLPFGLFPALIYYTGCRRGEAQALTGSDIDRKAMRVHIRRSVYYDHGAKIKEPKTAAGVREVPLLPALDALLPKKLPQGYLFAEPDGSLLTDGDFRKLYTTYCAASGVTVSLHQIRHGYATALFEAGVDPKTAQKLLGHAKLSTTMDIYTHVYGDAIAAAAEKMKKSF